MKEARRNEPKKAMQAKRVAVPESRARRETLESKRDHELPANPEEPVATGGSRSLHATASRVGRQPVLESPEEHPAARGPRMPEAERRRERAQGATMKPGAAVSDDEEE